MKKRCMIVSGGDFSSLPEPTPDCLLIACDRGLRYALDCGLRPDLVVGDFDSCDLDQDAGIPVMRFPVEKDDTDTMLAIRAAIDLGCEEAELYCALGGRLDHTLANLQSLLFAQKHGMHLRIVSPDTEILALENGVLRLPRREGFSLSVFSVSELSRGVSIRGTKYEIKDAALSFSFPLGVSNQWREPEAEIRVEDGTLLIVLSRL